MQPARLAQCYGVSSLTVHSSITKTVCHNKPVVYTFFVVAVFTHTRFHRSFHTTSGGARICCEEGQSFKLGHGALTANFRAGCSGFITNNFVSDAVLIERAVSC